MQQVISQLKNLGQTFKGHSLACRRNNNSVAYGAVTGAKLNLIASIKNFVLVVTADSITANSLSESLKLYGKNPVIISSKEEVLLYNKAFSQESSHQRLSALYKISQGHTDTAIITVDSLARKFPPAERFAEAIITFRTGRDYNLGSLVKRLVFAGYKREAMAEGAGQFALRGDILDIFPINYINPIRIEFFGDTVEQIKLFDIESGKSFKNLNEAEVSPATDIFIYEDEIAALLQTLDKSQKSISLQPQYRQKLESIAADIESRLNSGGRETSLSFIMPFISGDGHIENFLPEDSVIVFDEEKILRDKVEIIYNEHYARYEQLLPLGEILKESYAQYVDKSLVLNQFGSHCKTAFNMLGKAENFVPEQVFELKTTPVRKYALNFKDLSSDVANWIYGGYKVVICSATDEGCEDISGALKQNGVLCEISDDIDSVKQKAVITKLKLTEGFIYHAGKFVLIASYDIQPKSRQKGVKRRKKDVFLTPEIGDYIVHEVHGIGICKGIKNLKTANIGKDYIVIEYKEGDTLYVPCDQMDLVAKYAGSDTLPKLNKLGGKEFERLKQKVKRYVKEMAFDLKQLYAERESKKGYAFSPDSPMQKDFEDAFEFDETEDQLRSIAEIKADMESDKVMDRLLCGDVGYGKTEVALRAAFKSVIDSKQVAFLAPTTILSQQHYNLCIKRFGEFGVRIEVLNRFKTAAEQKEILTHLSQGHIDILVGTHRLLSKDVVYKDLGLLIVDEEQRFGVEDKEKIKNMKAGVDVLTLSATPIPRTLHMSLSGIRDISVLDTPPRERLPVQTYVLEYSEALVRDAVVREMSRGGQVFILYNKVDSIQSFAYKVSQIVPEAKIITAHGQMNEDNLERAIESFYQRQADVMICTTIIENGIDIPTVNTLIVYESDRLGLSQLYQLRGRVGRSNRLAHVFFTYIPEKVLTESAYKRLKAIMEFTELGSGFKIAMRDLEIRGAGNVLGKQQHGHMENVGYDMYCRLLRQSVQEIGGEMMDSSYIESDIQVDSYIPEKYIEDNNQRMKVYQKIAGIEELSERKQIYEELSDIYGVVPQPVLNLINISAVKLLAKAIKAESVTIKPQGGAIGLSSLDTLQNDKLMAAIEQNKTFCMLSFAEKPAILFNIKGLNADKVLNNILKFLLDAA